MSSRSHYSEIFSLSPCEWHSGAVSIRSTEKPTVSGAQVLHRFCPAQVAGQPFPAEGLERGFIEVVAGPMVRSSYRAEQVLQKNNVGLAVG